MTILAISTLQNDLATVYDMTYYFNYPNKKKVALKKFKNHSFDELINQSKLHEMLYEVRNRYCDLLA